MIFSEYQLLPILFFVLLFFYYLKEKTIDLICRLCYNLCMKVGYYIHLEEVLCINSKKDL